MTDINTTTVDDDVTEAAAALHSAAEKLQRVADCKEKENPPTLVVTDELAEDIAEIEKAFLTINSHFWDAQPRLDRILASLKGTAVEEQHSERVLAEERNSA